MMPMCIFGSGSTTVFGGLVLVSVPSAWRPLQSAHDLRPYRRFLTRRNCLCLCPLSRPARIAPSPALAAELQGKIGLKSVSSQRTAQSADLLCDSRSEFCRFRSSMFCWWPWFLRRMNVMYSAAFFRICARLACNRTKIRPSEKCFRAAKRRLKRIGCQNGHSPLSRPAATAPSPAAR